MTEREIEKRIVELTKEAGGIAYKFVSPGNTGVPDRIVILPGQRPVFVEVKAQAGRLTAVQRRQIERLEKLDQPVMVIQGEKDLAVFEKQMRSAEGR